jgi:hypothetical protein
LLEPFQDSAFHDAFAHLGHRHFHSCHM